MTTLQNRPTHDVPNCNGHIDVAPHVFHGKATEADIPTSAFMASRRLWYRAPLPEDAPLITAWRSDPRVRRTTQPRFPINVAAANLWVEKQNPWERGKANDHATFVFGCHGSDAAIGMAGLFAIQWIDRSAEFGIAIGPDHWNRGYGREVADQLLRYAFHELNLHRVELTVLASNPGGIKAYQAAGYVLEGTKRQAANSNGRLEDILLMAALRHDWKSRASHEA